MSIYIYIIKSNHPLKICFSQRMSCNVHYPQEEVCVDGPRPWWPGAVWPRAGGALPADGLGRGGVHPRLGRQGGGARGQEDPGEVLPPAPPLHPRPRPPQARGHQQQLSKYPRYPEVGAECGRCCPHTHFLAAKLSFDIKSTVLTPQWNISLRPSYNGFSMDEHEHMIADQTEMTVPRLRRLWRRRVWTGLRGRCGARCRGAGAWAGCWPGAGWGSPPGAAWASARATPRTRYSPRSSNLDSSPLTNVLCNEF